MKLTLFLFFSQILFLTACNENKNNKPSTAVETGMEFIRASLDGDFKKAQEFLLKDNSNHQYFESYKAYYNKLALQDRENYKSSSFEINKLLELNDSVVIINYSNSYMHKPMEIKVVKEGKAWVVDFAYTLSGNLPIN